MNMKKQTVFLKMRSGVLMILSAIMVFGVFGNTAYAVEPYQGYYYNNDKEKIPSPNFFLPQQIVSGQKLGIGAFGDVTDFCIDKSGCIYIMDSEKDEIVVVNPDFSLNRVIRPTLNGEIWQMSSVPGIFVSSSGDIFAADKGNGVVLKMDTNGVIKHLYGKPQTEMIDANISFAPTKVIEDSSGTLYILSDNISNGAVVLDANGSFLNFFGANKVETTLDTLGELLWRRFSTKTQISQREAMQPADYTSFYIDGEDFVYTCTLYEKANQDRIKKLNPKGVSILENHQFGDVASGDGSANAFVDIAADNDGFFYVLDGNTAKVFIYSPSAELIGVFGAMGQAKGQFSKPISLDVFDGQIFVLDGARKTLTVFNTTVFGNAVREAICLHEKGKYEEAMVPWKKVLQLNGNYEPAYVGIGRALFMTGQYKEAMRYYRLGNNRALYSQAYKQQRNVILREHFREIIIGIILLFVLYCGLKCLKKRRGYIIRSKGGRNGGI